MNRFIFSYLLLFSSLLVYGQADVLNPGYLDGAIAGLEAKISSEKVALANQIELLNSEFDKSALEYLKFCKTLSDKPKAEQKEALKAWHESDAGQRMKKLQAVIVEFKSQEEARKRAYEARDAANNINSRRPAQITSFTQQVYDDEFGTKPPSRKAIALGESAETAAIAAVSVGSTSHPEDTAILDIIEETSLFANTDDVFVSGQAQTVFEYDERGRRAKEFVNGVLSKEFFYDQFDNLIQVNIGEKTYKYIYDYRGRRLIVDETGAGGKYKRIYYSGGTAVAETEHHTSNGPAVKTTLYYRGPDMGGGVGGILYTADENGNNSIYYHYNLRGDVIMKTDKNNNAVFSASYEAFGENTVTASSSDDRGRHRANTKEEDPTGLLNEGRRYRDLHTAVFLTPDPLEYVDGLNMHIYVGQNPWGRFDPEGLFFTPILTDGGIFAAQKKAQQIASNPRAMGVVQIVGGAAQIGFAAYSVGQTGGGALTTALPYALTALGSDNITAGAAQIWTGEFQKTQTNRALSSAMPQEAADIVEMGIDVASGGVAVRQSLALSKIGALKNEATAINTANKTTEAASDGVKTSGSKSSHAKKLEPNPDATGDHTSFTRNQDGQIDKYSTFREQTNPRNPNPWEVQKRFKRGGDPHFEKSVEKRIEGPQVHENGVRRPAKPDEIPGGQ